MVPRDAPERARGLCPVHVEQVDRIEALEDIARDTAHAVAEIRRTLGRPPDLSTGTPGSGMADVVHRLAERLVEGADKRDRVKGWVAVIAALGGGAGVAELVRQFIGR